MSETSAIETSTRILLSVNAKPVVMVKPDGNVLIDPAASLTDASLAFWRVVANHGRAMNAARNSKITDIAQDMRVFGSKLGGTFGDQLSKWSEALFAAVEGEQV